MARIKMIIADTDAAYVSNLGDFLLASYAQAFEIVSFSKLELLEQYLTTQEVSGILLITPELAKPEFDHPGLTQILLTAIPDIAAPGANQVFKYQKGPDLVQSILKLFSEGENASIDVIAFSRKTKVVTVYSPAGGVGKTTLAVGCSLQTAWEGNSVFYLNLENVPSTELFFTTEAEGGLSTAFFYLHEKKKNLNLRIATLKKTDSHSQIHYFTPADSMLDLWEDLETELTTLIQILKNSGFYDYVFIDLSSQINANNLAVLEASDVILLISTPELSSRLKVDLLHIELARWTARNNSSILERILPVWNKWEHDSNWDGGSQIGAKDPLAKIPKVKDLLLPVGNRFKLDLNGPLGAALYEIRASFKN